MNKYFELQYWLTIIGLAIVAISIIIGLIKIFIVDFIIEIHHSKSKKWEYNYVAGRWERVEEV